MARVSHCKAIVGIFRCAEVRDPRTKIIAAGGVRRGSTELAAGNLQAVCIGMLGFTVFTVVVTPQVVTKLCEGDVEVN